MTWRNRNLFKKKAVPVQKFNMGGSVRGVEALKNVAPTLSTFDYDNAVNMMGGGMVDMPVQQMNMGGMPLEMFETGDPAINSPLNTQAVDMMNQALMTGGGDAVPQSMMAAPMAEETPMMNEGPRTSNGGAEEFTAQALEEAKQSLQDTIAVAMSEIEKEIDTMEEVSVDEMKSLAELIVRQQQRLDDATVQLTKTMGLGEQLDITLFDNEFEREVEKKYPLVAAALAKTLPNIMDTDKLVAADMPSGDTPVPQMEPGGEVLDTTGKTDEQIKMDLLERKRILEQEIRDLQKQEQRFRNMPTPRTEEADQLKKVDIPNKQKELLAIDQQIATGIIVQKEEVKVELPETGREYVERDLASRAMGKQRTFEDVVEQPAVQQIFSDLDNMVKKMGFGNIKDTKVTGTGAMTQAIRDKSKGEAAGDAIKLQAKTKLLGDIEGDPFNTKGGTLTTAKLDQLLEGDLTADAAFRQSRDIDEYGWLSTGKHVPKRIRERIGVANSYKTKEIGGTTMNFIDLFNEATMDPEISTYINSLSQPDTAKRRLIEILIDSWNKGQFIIGNVKNQLIPKEAKK